MDKWDLRRTHPQPVSCSNGQKTPVQMGEGGCQGRVKGRSLTHALRRSSPIKAVGCSQHPVLGDQGAPTHVLPIFPQADLPRPLARLGILP